MEIELKKGRVTINAMRFPQSILYSINFLFALIVYVFLSSTFQITLRDSSSR